MKKKYTLLMLSLIMVFSMSFTAFADVVEGDRVISLGQDLTEDQKQQMLNNFGANGEEEIIYVTNQDEHNYLGDYIPAGKIGSKAISSAMITYTKKGSGIKVDISSTINYVTGDMYRNALQTAGVEDADIKVDSPVNVSGTAALTGIMKAYEFSTGTAIPEEVKKAANEELVVTSELGETIGSEKATELINDIKVKIAEEKPQSREEVKQIVINIVNQYNINLSDGQIESITNFFDHLRTIDIDWDALGDRAMKFAGKAKDYLSSEEGQSFLRQLQNFFNRFFDWFAGLFK